MPLPCGGEGTFQGLLGVSLVSPLRAVAGQRPALAVSQSDFFQFGHAAVPAGVQSERLRQAKATKGFAWCMEPSGAVKYQGCLPPGVPYLDWRWLSW
jgi:hypothetical protein